MAKILTPEQHSLKKRASVMEDGLRQQFESGFMVVHNEQVEIQTFSTWGNWMVPLANAMASNLAMLLEVQRACGLAAQEILAQQMEDGNEAS